MEQLQITARIKGPLIRGNGQLTLDALLAAQVYETTGDLDAAHNKLPIKQTSGLYWASRALIEGPVQRRAIVQSLRPDNVWLDERWLKKNKHGSVHTKFSNLSDNILNSYAEVLATSITWYCTGDSQRVLNLLQGITHIGKKRSALVTDWQVEEGPLDGLHGYDDEPLRPVPIEMWDGDKSVPIVDATWRPAYFDMNNAQACYQ